MSIRSVWKLAMMGAARSGRSYLALIVCCVSMTAILFAPEPSSSREINPYLFIRLSPNPASTDIQCSLYGLYSLKDPQSLTCKIYDMLGREVEDVSYEARAANNGSVSKFEVDVSALSPGTYLFNMQCDTGSKQVRFIVTRRGRP